ncbi:MAG TPA: hypothetical protein PKO25_14965 [Spirochaetota bacterium]|jgi:hypothetical protein|nr:hypothetical protein [Spirochaetota bacterium]HPI14531.1 hypothetical protein [Spirochaetota bacterium]HPV97010.1 hypothetical protein [Spirochaetota bacterium]
MKVSIDAILGSARKINNQRQVGEESPDGKRGDGLRSDRVEIENRVASRIDNIQKELREIQTSLTRNQIIRDGIARLQEDMARGGMGSVAILDETRFEGQAVLREFVGQADSPSVLAARRENIGGLIAGDVAKLTRLQVEVENITASNVVNGERIGALVGSVEEALGAREAASLGSISSLKEETVSRLVR